MSEKIPFVTKEQLEDIASRYATPFYLYDEKGIRETARRVNKAFSWNKGFKEYFAVKATPTPGILKILHEEGCGADCSSYTELLMADAVGFKGDEIMFSSNDTPAEDFQLARKLNATINLDDITHIDFLERVADIPDTVCCRYNPGGHFAIANNIMDNPGDAKYGMTREQLTEAYKRLMAKGVKHFGLHAFLASNTVTNDYYPELARILFKVAVELKEETGASIEFINLSGGVGIAYRPGQPQNDIMEIGEGVRRAYEEVLVPAGMGNVRLYTEMGRYMLAPYGALVSRVIHQKHIYKEYIGLDACAANLMRPAIYGAYHHITVMGKENAPCDHKYDVTGGLCENNDKFAIDRMLPEINIGDLVFIHDAGAHGFAMGYNYNGKLRSAELLLKEDGSVEMIRRAETPADYFATFDFTGLFNKD
ncbi:diaminopimelate decarboxylase [Phascolarctobacterium sp. ET69]|jgi:diaminopimelate decarboxylase|uniref:diaminopimelate decarboxylase n=1 Tax=Phascolarctobacterium sp. ET69 TaxID=2939420 RepID=UPI0020123037|nr:diaminopimelate decarboxylase [Phascolarctobacterium sp. ET69]MCL1605064.1 diaminopimelate decarboxylase [Phascolarctobacterium sp. ET69]